MNLDHETKNKQLFELNLKIQFLVTLLQELYQNRRGKIEYNNSDDAEICWCIGCGKNSVDVNGQDTCGECLGKI